MFQRRRVGATGTEAGLLVGLVAVVLIGSLSAVGQRLNDIFSLSTNVLSQASVGNFVPSEQEKSLPVSCQEAYDRGETISGIYQIDITEGDEADALDVYCDMTRKGGGWTLVAVLADDDNDYWTWSNRIVTYDGVSITGNVSNISADFQSQAWHDLSGDEVLLTKANSSTDFLYYSTILSGSTLGSKYPKGTNTAVGEFDASDVFGTWWQQEDCSTNYTLSLVQPDTDSHGWQQASWGFVWRSNNNNGCGYDDVWGGLSQSYNLNDVNYTESEIGWRNGTFYRQNFLGSALQVWVR